MNKCIKCGVSDRMENQRWCKSCHAEYMRAWRRTHRLNDEQRTKDNCRSYAGVYKRRGKLLAEDCKVCGDPAEMHHADYSKPLDVDWLCKKHHQALHNV